MSEPIAFFSIAFGVSFAAGFAPPSWRVWRYFAFVPPALVAVLALIVASTASGWGPFVMIVVGGAFVLYWILGALVGRAARLIAGRTLAAARLVDRDS